MLWNPRRDTGPQTTLIDSWEDRNWSGTYTNYSGGFGFDDTYAADGTWSLYRDGAAGVTYNRIISTSGLPAYPSKGSIHNCYIRVSDTAGVEYRQLFGCGGGDSNRYLAKLDFGSGVVELRKLETGTNFELDSAAQAPSAGTWYRVRVIWSDGSAAFSTPADTITAEVYDHGTGTTPSQSGTQVVTVEATDATHATNTGWGVYVIGVDAAGQECWVDYAYLEPL